MNESTQPKRKHAAGAVTPRTAPQEWQLQDAKARFSEVFRLARERGPQRVTKHGKEAVLVISAEEYARILAPRMVAPEPGGRLSISQFFAASPLRGSGVELEDRPRDFGRTVEL